MRSDFNKICRLCLKLDVQLSYIFSKQSPLFTNFCKVVSKATATPIFEGDSLPSQICSDCMNTVFEILKFRKVCKDSFLFLQNFVLKNDENDCIVDHIARTNEERQQLNNEVQNRDIEEKMDTATSEIEVNVTDVETNSSEQVQDEEDIKILLNRYNNELKEENNQTEEENNKIEEENTQFDEKINVPAKEIVEVDVKINVCNLEPNVIVSVSEDAFQILEDTSSRLQIDVDPEEIMTENGELLIKDENYDFENSEYNDTQESVSQNDETFNTEASISSQGKTLTCFKTKSSSARKTTDISKNCKSMKEPETKNISTHINNVIARLLENASKKLKLSKRNNANQSKRLSDKRKSLLSNSVDSNNKVTKKSKSCLVKIKQKISDTDTGYKTKKVSTSKINKSATSPALKLRQRRTRYYSGPPRYMIVQESRLVK